MRGDHVITALKRPGNGELSHNDDELPNIMNSFFSSIGPDSAARIPQAQKHFSSFLPKQKYAGDFVFKPVTPIEIEAEILSIPLNKVYGLYSCPTRILKCASKIISSPLCKLINNSIETGAYPSKLKHAKVVPVYKGEDKTDPSNYRPISLLSIFNRIFEKTMYHRLMAYLEVNGILCDSQYGFREKHSTEYALIDIVNQIQSHFHEGMLSCGVCIDLKKAFDTIDHYILLQKLYHYGIRGIINDWFHSYLTERVQSTLIGSKVSTKLLTACGVPQGSVLRLLLFLLYVNDLCRSSDKLSFYLFADDTNLLYADRDINSLERVVNAELSKVQEWLIANRLTLNAKKSNFVIFHPYQKKLDRDVILKIFDIKTNDFVPLDQKTYIKYLGILIDSNLIWKYHISYITSKISKTIGVIARLSS